MYSVCFTRMSLVPCVFGGQLEKSVSRVQCVGSPVAGGGEEERKVGWTGAVNIVAAGGLLPGAPQRPSKCSSQARPPSSGPPAPVRAPRRDAARRDPVAECNSIAHVLTPEGALCPAYSELTAECPLQSSRRQRSPARGCRAEPRCSFTREGRSWFPARERGCGAGAVCPRGRSCASSWAARARVLRGARGHHSPRSRPSGHSRPVGKGPCYPEARGAVHHGRRSFPLGENCLILSKFPSNSEVTQEFTDFN